MHLPDSFISTIKNTFGADGETFLTSLPSLVDESTRRWELTSIRPVSNLSYNFVAFAKRGEEEVVLKIGVPRDELMSEMAALDLFNGDGACRLLDCDPQKGLLLLERLNPGGMLSELQDDDKRTHIAADVMQKIWRDAPADATFIRLADWFHGLKRIRTRFEGRTGPFPKEILERVESILPELFEAPSLLLHGDFHHFNILSSERGWQVIDPKGVIGPAGYEIGPLMLNPWISPLNTNQFKVQTERRVGILSERLGWERGFILNWATAHAVLSAWWDFEENMDWQYPISCAQVFANLG